MITEKISNGGVLSGTINASSNLTMGIGSSNNLVGGNINTFTKETDPTIPDYIKAISKEDIAGWDNNAVVNEEQNKTLVGLEELIDAITPKNTASGKIVHTTDALVGSSFFKNKISGKAKQKTTKGIQLFNNKDVLNMSSEVTIDENDWITMAYDNTDGTTTQYLNLFTNKSKLLKENTTYRVMVEIKNISQKNVVAGSYLTLIGREDQTQFSQSIHFPVYTTSKGIFKYDLTTKETFDETTTMMTRNFLAINAGDSISITFRLSILKDTTITTDNFIYEEFTNGTSPNPEYPQEIEVVQGYNLFNSFIATKQKNQLGELYIEDDGTFIVKNNPGSNNYFALEQTIGELCPDLKIGDRVYLHLETTSTVQNIHIGENWYNNNAKTITPAIWDKRVIIYGGYNQTDTIKIHITKEPNPTYLPYGCVGIGFAGEQLYNYKNVTAVSNGVTTDEEGWITVSYDNTNGSSWKSFNYFTHNLNIKESTYYNILCEIKSVSGDGKLELVSNLYTNPVQGQFPAITGIPFSSLTANSIINYTIKSYDDFSIRGDLGLRTYVSVSAGSKINITFRISVIKDTSLNINNFIYKPYKEKKVYLNLKENFIGKIKTNIEDYLITDRKRVWLIKNTAIKEYATEDIMKMSFVTYDNIDYARFKKPSDYIGAGVNKNYKLLCNKATFSDDISWLDFPDVRNIGKLKAAAEGGYFWIGFPKGTTAEEMKEKLTNLKILYPLKETQIIELGELSEVIKILESVNNIHLLTNIPTEIEVEYALDIKKYADDRYLELTNALVSTGANL